MRILNLVPLWWRGDNNIDNKTKQYVCPTLVRPPKQGVWFKAKECQCWSNIDSYSMHMSRIPTISFPLCGYHNERKNESQFQDRKKSKLYFILITYPQTHTGVVPLLFLEIIFASIISKNWNLWERKKLFVSNFPYQLYWDKCRYLLLMV